MHWLLFHGHNLKRVLGRYLNTSIVICLFRVIKNIVYVVFVKGFFEKKSFTKIARN